MTDQRGGVIGRAESTADQCPRPEYLRAQWATEREPELALDESETVHSAALQSARSRLEAGTYGEWTQCGTHINAAWLHATLAAARRMQCQAAAEQHDRAVCVFVAPSLRRPTPVKKLSPALGSCAISVVTGL